MALISSTINFRFRLGRILKTKVNWLKKSTEHHDLNIVSIERGQPYKNIIRFRVFSVCQCCLGTRIGDNKILQRKKTMKVKLGESQPRIFLGIDWFLGHVFKLRQLVGIWNLDFLVPKRLEYHTKQTPEFTFLYGFEMVWQISVHVYRFQIVRLADFKSGPFAKPTSSQPFENRKRTDFRSPLYSFEECSYLSSDCWGIDWLESKTLFLVVK